MTNHELVRVDPEDVHRLGQLVASSMYFEDAREAAQAAVKILAGQELGLGPIASMRGIDIIKGEVTLAANLVAALVRRSGTYDYRVSEWTNERCVIRFLRHGRDLEPVSVFSIEDARRAGLTGSNWQKYPRNMLFARAMTNGARLHCPDVFVGAVYTHDELIDLPEIEASAVPEVEEVPEVGEEPQRPAESPETASAGRVARPVDADLVSDSQYGYLTGLIREARARGMTVDDLRDLLEAAGLGDVEVGEGWLRALTRRQASSLIGALEVRARSGHRATEEQPWIDPAGT